jgi:hypothetical protein
MHFSFSLYPTPLHVSNRVTVHHQQAVTVYAATVTACWWWTVSVYAAKVTACWWRTVTVYAATVTACWWRTVTVYAATVTACWWWSYCICNYSNCLLVTNSYSIRNMKRIDYWDKLRKKSASDWSLLSRDNNFLVFCVDATEHTYHTHSQS